MSNFLENFIKAQSEITSIEPNATNPHYKSDYVTLSACENMVKPILSKNGIGFTFKGQCLGEDQIVNIIFFDKNTDYDKPTTFLTSTIKLILTKKDMQGLGSAITYAKRYLLMSSLGFSSGYDDDDANEVVKQPVQQTKPKPTVSVSKVEENKRTEPNLPNKAPNLLLTRVVSFAKTKNVSNEDLSTIAMKLHGTRILTDLTEEQLNTIGAHLKTLK